MQTTLRITLPLALPAILGSVFLVFLEVLGLYGTPALIAIPARLQCGDHAACGVLRKPGPGRGRRRLLDADGRHHHRAVVGAAPPAGAQSYVTVGGKGGHREPMALGGFRWVLFGYAMAIAAFSVFMPLYIILQTAFSKAWALPMSPRNFTFNNFQQVLFDQLTVRQALFNTFHYAILTATICTILGFAVAYISQRRLLPFVESARQHHAGAIRGARHRAGDLLLCGLCAAAVRAVRPRRAGRDRLRHALPADLLHQFQFGDPGPASRA